MATLPQKLDVPAQVKRKSALVDKAKDYDFASSPSLPSVPKIEDLPPRERADPTWLKGEERQRRKILFNAAGATTNGGLLLNDLGDYERVYPGLSPQPQGHSIWRRDHVFGEQRLSGVFPNKIKRVVAMSDLPPDCRIDNDDVKPVLAGKTLEEAVAEHRLYMCDYQELVGKGSNWSLMSGSRYATAPIVLLYWETLSAHPEAMGQMRPIAIQIERPPANPNPPVFTPKSPSMTWLVAKMFAANADAMLHELVAHLTQTHLLMEPFVIAAERKLSADHPLLVLLRPHFAHLLHLNEGARDELLAPGAHVDDMFSTSLAASLSIADQAFATFRFWDMANPVSEVETRHMHDKDVLPHYPFRDDGKALYEAMERFVAAYVDVYYPGTVSDPDLDVREDFELQAFAADVQSKGKIKQLTEDPLGKIRHKADLVGVLTRMLWTLGPQHSAVNFTQWEWMSIIPNMPFGMFEPPPQEDDRLDEGDVLKFLPRQLHTLQQIAVVFVLGAHRIEGNKIGSYPSGTFAEPDAAKRQGIDNALAAFTVALAGVTQKIVQNNDKRLVDYWVLMPANVARATDQ